MDKKQALLQIYLEHPCRTLPNAFWKTAKGLDAYKLDITRDEKSTLTSLIIRDGSRLLAYWCKDPQDSPLANQDYEAIEFALVHENNLAVFEKDAFPQRQAYFRLIHKEAPADFTPPPGFAFENVRPEDEVSEVVQLIQRCYHNIHITPDVVRGWLDHPVYEPDLWVWMIDSRNGKRVGLGIAEVDLKVPEASLEWVQVLPGYQRKGLGSALVRELLRRVGSEVSFTTVSGEVDNWNRPEKLYRHCGFTGSDTWWLLQVV